MKAARHFLTRALLSARNLAEVQVILRDFGTGSAHGFCVNMAFIHQVFPVLIFLVGNPFCHDPFSSRYHAMTGRPGLISQC